MLSNMSVMMLVFGGTCKQLTLILFSICRTGLTLFLPLSLTLSVRARTLGECEDTDTVKRAADVYMFFVSFLSLSFSRSHVCRFCTPLTTQKKVCQTQISNTYVLSLSLSFTKFYLSRPLIDLARIVWIIKRHIICELCL